MTIQESIIVKTSGRGMMNITTDVADIVSKSKIETGICNVFLHHTSASLILCENYDPQVQMDLELFMNKLVPEGDSLFKHVSEGPDDMPAHVRTVLTQNSISIPITNNQIALGTWQGIYVWEHRLQAHERTITVTICWGQA